MSAARMRDSVLAAILRRSLRYGVIAVVAVLLRTVLLPIVFPNTVLPDLLLPCVVAVALGEDERIAGAFGIVAGFLSDALGTTGIATAPLCYFAVGYLCGVLIRFVLRRNLPSFLIFTVCASLVALPFSAVIGAEFSGVSVPLNRLFTDTVLPEFCGTVLCAPLAWAVILFPLRREMRDELKN